MYPDNKSKSRNLVFIDGHWLYYDAIGISRDSYKSFDIEYIGQSDRYEQNGVEQTSDEPLYFFRTR